MAIFEIASDTIRKVSETTFGAEGIHERKDLQRLLRTQIEIIATDTLIIAEELSEWEDSKRRIDLLGVDKSANLVVIELKRTEDGGHMELQAIRYAAMVSTMTLDKAVEVYEHYLKQLGSNEEARTSLLEFLDKADDEEIRFNADVRIILVSAEFSRELTTAVLWLNERAMDIRCIRIKPYKHNGSLLMDVQQVIPLPEAADYQTQVREKNRTERIERESSRDFTKFDVTISGSTQERMAKRQAILRVVKQLCASGVTPEQIVERLPWYKRQMFASVIGNTDKAKFVEQATALAKQEGRSFAAKRYFCDPQDLISANGKTYAFSSQWGTRTQEALATLLSAFPDRGISFRVSDSV